MLAAILLQSISVFRRAVLKIDSSQPCDAIFRPISLKLSRFGAEQSWYLILCWLCYILHFYVFISIKCWMVDIRTYRVLPFEPLLTTPPKTKPPSLYFQLNSKSAARCGNLMLKFERWLSENWKDTYVMRLSNNPLFWTATVAACGLQWLIVTKHS